MERRKMMKSLFAMIMAFALVFQLASPLVAFAAVSDRDTSDKYTESLGDNASTEYAGRVWTDKSVFTNDVTFDTYGGGSVTVPIDPDADEDFLISYSALATSEAISGQSQAPVDVVLILDISGSMSNAESNMDNNKSRIYNTVQAANEAIDELMALNAYTRVAVVAFSSNATTLLPLDRYSEAIVTENVWVQTGIFPWQGYYEEVTTETPYFTLNRESASENYADLTTNAVSQTTGRTINSTVDVEGGTNIQVGLYEGMKLLADEQSTKANINGAQVQRTPSVILLSDGSPTYSSDSEAWWAPADNNDDGPGSRPYAGNGFKAILVGSYMKDAIDRNYGVADTAYATTVYTVGMGITGLEDNEKNLAYMTLDPGTYWNDAAVTNSMKTTIKNYWSSYHNSTSVNINVGQYRDRQYQDKSYTLTHPTTGYDVDPTTGYDYVDDYYDADNAAAVTSVFETIVSEISITAPQVPTEIKGTDPLTDGYITYTDPIGKYMEVKDVKSIIYAGTEFTQKAVSAAGNVTTYVFSGEVHSPVYGDQNIDDIVITVTEAADGSQTLVVKIPAAVIPLRVNEVTLNADGSVKSHTNNGAFPARVIYSVGLQEGIKQVSDDGHEYVDATKLTAEYKQAQTNADGSINFYSNVYTGENTVHGYTAGNAVVEFEPSHTNPFYYILEDMPIYKDTAFANQVTVADGIDPDTTYYYKEEYYHGTSVEVKAIARTGEQLLKTEIVTGTDGYLYRAAGSPRLNRILEFEGTKTANATGTAEDFYAPTFVHADGNPDPFAGKFVIYHGNNGIMSLPVGGNLEISKTVAAAAGLTAPGENFTFTIDLDGDKINGGVYSYVIRNAANAQVGTGTVSRVNDTITLKDGETATIYSLPPATTYAITEAAVAGFATESEGATGTIHAGQTAYADFTNTYSVQSVVSAPIQGKKLLTGLVNWPSNYSFTFFLSPYNNCPLPAGYDADKGVTVTAADANGLEAEFTFGAIEFTAPGTYRYTVAEKEPENDGYLPGMTYSRALFRLVYEVVDNGDGTLSIQSANIQRLYADDATPLFTYGSDNQIVMNPGEEGNDAISFTNTYEANSVTRVPTARKAYSDPSGTKPLASGMFQFQMKALGYIVDNGTLQTDVSKVPMPAGSVGGVIVTSNEGHNITFPHVTFTQNLLTDNGATKMTYRYELSEVIPEDGDKVPGMTYDNTTYTVDVVVEMDTAGTDLLVSAIYPNDLRIATFSNSYALESVTADINGSKILNGRDMLAGESFHFELVGANAATNNAVRDGYVIVPESTASVTGGSDGQKLSFAFEDIEFKRPGTYSFLVSEEDTGAAAVQYDDSKILVTFEIADTNNDAKLEVVSTTYSQGGSSADFVNTYTYRFNDTPVELVGIKNLTGKTLISGEFYFDVMEYCNGTLVNDRFVTHTADLTGSNGVYTGSISILDDVTYTEPGVYEYYITEQIPDDAHKVGGTTYDDAQYRFTVTVEDDNQGSLKIADKKLEQATDTGWTDAGAVVFNNSYEAGPTTASLPLIKKVLSGDRTTPLTAGEFSFRLSLVSADPSDGITLPAETEVYNNADGDVAFGHLTFTKAGTYTVKVSEIIPDDADKVPGVIYSTEEISATFHVTDDRNGNLTAHLIGFVSDPTITNKYAPDPITYTPTAKKIHDGEAMRSFDFTLTDNAGVFASQTKQNDADGNVVFEPLTFTEEGTYEFTIKEQQNALWGFIKWDTNEYTLKITVTNNSGSQLVIEDADVLVTSLFGRNDLVFRNAHEDIITKKTVELASNPGVLIDGNKVEVGDVLVYNISYTNYTGVPADVTVTDVIPAHTQLENAGTATVNGNTLTWNLTAIPAYETVTVSFSVKVIEAEGAVENQAKIEEGNNTYFTNETSNPVTEDAVEKDVFLASDHTVSIDGEKVNVNDELLYTITYVNEDDQAGTVTITDVLPETLTYVDGSADNGGSFDGSKVIWTVPVAASSSVTVSFRATVNAVDSFIENKAEAIEDGNRIETNIVWNHTYEEVGGKDVALESKPSISIDGQMVQVGDVLIYTIDYTNVTGAPVDVTITDVIPAHTELVEAINGTVNGTTVTWALNAVQPQETVTVTLKVKVIEPGNSIENQAQIFDGTNKVTNKVTNSVPEKTVDKQTANLGDTLTYTITYTNETGAPAKVVITDELSQALTFVEGTAGEGVYADGIITWTLENVPAGEEVTVTFQAKVTAAGEVSNTAQIVENDTNAVFTNETVTKVEEKEPEKEPEKPPVQPPVTPPATPQTGDSFNAGLFISLMVLSSFGLAALLVGKKREEAEESAQ